MKKYCVYIHRNTINNKVYIGQTCLNVQDRWRNNGSGYLKKKNGNYTQPVFARAILKYGWDSFEHIIFADNLTQDEANQIERILIALYKTDNKNYGYNIRSGGDNSTFNSEESKKRRSEAHKGIKHSEESKNKMSESHKGNKNRFGTTTSEEGRKNMSESHKGIYPSEETRKKMGESHKGKNAYNARKVVQYDLNNNIIKIWDCINDASRELNIPQANIIKVCKYERKKAGGFIWHYYEEEVAAA